MPLIISGTVTEQSTPAVRLVRLYLRETGELIDEQYSSTSGEFLFVGLPEFGEGIEFYVVAFDDDAGEAFNALIYDRIEVFNDSAAGEHRYWRLVDLDIPGDGSGNLEVSEIRVFVDSVDVTDDATQSASEAPFSGVLSSIFDNNLSTRCVWTEAVAEDAAFYIQFDFGFGGDVELDALKQGGFDTATRYMQGFSVEHSDNGTDWTLYATKSGLTYPGNFTLSSEYALP
jgi:hypothetical protein